MINLTSIITSIIPMNDIVNLLCGDMLKDITKQLEELPKQIEDINKQLEELNNSSAEETTTQTKEEKKASRKSEREKKQEEAKKKADEKKEQIKAEMKQKLEDTKKKLEEQIETLKERLKQIPKDIQAQVEKSIEEAQQYADKIVHSSEAIPPAATGYITALGSLITQASGAISAAVMNPGSISFTLPSILAATQTVNKAKGDLKAASLQLITDVTDLEKALGIVFNIPVVGTVIKTAIMTPINVCVDLVKKAMSIIP